MAPELRFNGTEEVFDDIEKALDWVHANGLYNNASLIVVVNTEEEEKIVKDIYSRVKIDYNE